jgi:putative FmdB family regulatory protein
LPIYGYRCQSCQREFEVQKRMSDPPQEACPDCGGPGARLFYPAGILFKGSGFYKTDSRPAATASASSSPAAATPATDNGGSTAPPAPAKSSTTPASASGGTGTSSTSSPKANAAAD